MSANRYWVDPVELMHTEQYNEPDVLSGHEAGLVVYAYEYDKLAKMITDVHRIATEAWGTTGANSGLERIKALTADTEGK